MNRGARQRFLWVGLAAAVFALATLPLASRTGAQTPTVRLGVPPGDVMAGGAPFNVDVVVEDATNLGAFQFDLSYDSPVLAGVSVEQGPFLASSGRQVQCLDPRMNPGSIRFVCVTLGAVPPGAEGSGVLASITFAPNAAGTSSLQLQDVILASPDGQAIPSTSENASITVVSPGAPGTAAASGTPPAPTVALLTPVTTPPVSTPAQAATPAASPLAKPTPTLMGTPATTEASDGGGMNWPLWGSVIGGAGVLMAAGAGLFWWSRPRPS